MPEGQKTGTSRIFVEQNNLDSSFLKREVIFDAYLPKDIEHPEKMSLLLINDGQDLPKMLFDEMLNTLLEAGEIEPLLCIGIYCGADRKMEYGTAGQADYKGRGARAGLYTRFVMEELIPFIHRSYAVPSFKEKSFAGFSMGALSALDIIWNYPWEFAKAGCFSGSFWWRNKGYADGYTDAANRIMHNRIRAGSYYPWLKFFFQCGRLDETQDRNKNGVIDSIDDTRDLIGELRQKGYPAGVIEYLELPEGTHDVPTWASAFPSFLKWGWGTQTHLTGSGV